MDNQTTSQVDESIPFPKPLTSSSHVPLNSRYAADLHDLSAPPADPPPPYPAGRPSRRTRGSTVRSARHASQPSDGLQPGAFDNGGESESSPLLGVRRERTVSHSSTIHSVQALAHTVFSLFEAETEPNARIADADRATFSFQSGSDIPFSQKVTRYIRPLMRRVYYTALFHLLVLNFFYGLGAWIFLFVGTLTGTTLLITLPLGAIICFFDLLGARLLARGEVALQIYFHGPLSVTPQTPRPPVFSRMRSLPDESHANVEQGRHDSVPIPETSFLRLTYLMFRDPTSYQALFYFLVIKPGLTLLITLAIIILVPPAFVLVIPAPAVLRAVRRIGIWQAEVAIDALGYT